LTLFYSVNKVGSRTSMAAPAGMWACPTCTYHNTNDKGTCDMCGTAKPAGGPPAPGAAPGAAPVAEEEVDGWACPACTFINGWDKANCDMCGHKQPPGARQGGQQQQPPPAPAAPSRYGFGAQPAPQQQQQQQQQQQARQPPPPAPAPRQPPPPVARDVGISAPSAPTSQPAQPVAPKPAPKPAPAAEEVDEDSELLRVDQALEEAREKEMKASLAAADLEVDQEALAVQLQEAKERLQRLESDKDGPVE